MDTSINTSTLHNCPNCGGRWEQIGFQDYEYTCDTCCMRLIDGVLVSRDCECESHEKGFNYHIEKDGKILNIVEEVLLEMKEKYEFVPEEREGFDALPIVDRLADRGIISWDTHHMFISEERSFGSIPCCIVDGVFIFPFLDCSEFNSGNLPRTPEDEMYFSIYCIVNKLIGNPSNKYIINNDKGES